MSLFPVITDEQMRYYQFKARQRLLLEKEETEWKEYFNDTNCKTVKKMSDSSSKDIGIQVTSNSSKKFEEKSVQKQDTVSQQTLKDYKSRIENLEKLITNMAFSSNNENSVPSSNIIQVPHQSSVLKFSQFYDSRMKIIQDSLRNSIQRLQSVVPASLRNRNFQDLKKKESGFYIPHDLQKKRAIARRAYLNSLNQQKLDMKPSIKSQMKSKQGYKQKAYRKNQRILKSNNFETNAKDIQESEDQNIETATNAILEDLLDETALAFRRIRLFKKERLKSAASLEKEDTSQKEVLTPNTEAPQQTSINIKWLKIKENLSILRQHTGKNNETNMGNVLCADEHTRTEHTTDTASKLRKGVFHSKEVFTNCEKRELYIAPEQIEEIQNHRTNYWEYLHQISRAKKGSFDPWILSNMVSESILDDCVEDICKELQDIPGSLISDIFYEEFIQTTI